jgi:hypothetical protein
VAFALTDEEQCNPSRYAMPALDAGALAFQTAPSAQPTIALTLRDLGIDSGMGPMLDTTKPNNLHVTPALNMSGAYQYLENFSSQLGASAVNQAALMVFTNRQPVPATTPISDAGEIVVDGSAEDGGVYSGAECSPPCGDAGAASGSACYASYIAQQIQSASTATPVPMQTYFVVFGNNPNEPTPVDYYQAIPGAQVIDAVTGDGGAGAAAVKFAQTVVAFGSCVYDLPPGIDDSGALRLTVEIPIAATMNQAPAAVAVPHEPSCNAANAQSANGWNIDNGRIRVCGSQCNDIQQAVLAQAFAEAAGVDGGARDAGGTPTPVQVAVTMACANGDGGN